MTHPGGGAQSPTQLLVDVKQFLFLIQYRLEECQSPAAARAILPDVDVALSRLDKALVLLQPDSCGSAPVNPDFRPVRTTRPRRSTAGGS
jgi:hypothetical protein